jgi:uncharacterized protein YbcI
MPDSTGVPETGPEREPGVSLPAAISRGIVRAMKKYYGKGPIKAKSYLMDDLLFVVMRGGVTTAEETMVKAGQEDAVREFRQRFENEMAERLTAMVERLTGRKVINYQSQILFDPDMLIEMFVFDRPLDAGEHEQGAAIADPEPVDEAAGGPVG